MNGGAQMHEKYMQMALKEARLAALEGEISIASGGGCKVCKEILARTSKLFSFKGCLLPARVA